MPDPGLLGSIDPANLNALTLARGHAIRATQVLKALSDAGDQGEVVMLTHLDAYLRTAQAEAVASRAWAAVAHAEWVIPAPAATDTPPGTAD